ncbi:MAG TPA: tyrosine-type recombinase/integrase [Streptosporangiaceae bacterium]
MGHIEDRWRRAGRKGTGRRWRVRYLDPAGRERSRSFDRKVDAERFLVQVAAEVQRGTWIDPAKARTTLRRQAADRLEGYHRDSSRAEKIRQHLDLHILPALGDYTLGQLAQRPSLISQFMASLPMSAGSAEQVYITLASILDAAVDDGLIARNPAKAQTVKRPRAPKRKVVPWTAGQVAEMREGMPTCWRAAIDCGSGLGLRGGEIFGLGPDEVDFLRRTVHVGRQIKRMGGRVWFAAPKGGRDRDVPLPQPVALRLSSHIAEFPPVPVTLPWHEPGNERRHGRPVTVELMFASRQRGAINPSTFNTTAWRPARRAAGIVVSGQGSGVGLHALRHYYASVLLAGGVDVRALSEYLGHHDPGFTLRVYAHLVPSAEGRALRAIEAAFADADGPVTAQEGGNAP